MDEEEIAYEYPEEYGEVPYGEESLVPDKTASVAEEQEEEDDDDPTKDWRKEWIKERVMSFMGISDELFYDEMLAENDNELEKKLDVFLDNFQETPYVQSTENRLFYVYRTWCDRLFEEEIFVQELGNLNIN